MPTNLWGGLFLTLLVAAVGACWALPLGIVLALGRRSGMPVIRALSVVYIETLRAAGGGAAVKGGGVKPNVNSDVPARTDSPG